MTGKVTTESHATSRHRHPCGTRNHDDTDAVTRQRVPDQARPHGNVYGPASTRLSCPTWRKHQRCGWFITE